MKALINNNGITIKELKKLVKNLPEVNDYGEDYGVWIENTYNQGLSNIAKTIMQLNKGDIILSSI